jgi:hypothetical protein
MAHLPSNFCPYKAFQWTIILMNFNVFKVHDTASWPMDLFKERQADHFK